MLICSDCGAWFIYPTPRAEDMASYYSAKADRGIGPELRVWRSGTRQSSWYVYLAAHIIKCYLGSKATDNRCMKIADVGAGDLELTLEIARILPAGHITAIDLHHLEKSKIPRDIVGRIDTLQIDLNQLDRPQSNLESEKFDVVICISVIEHVLEPSKLLSFLFQIAKPGGLVYVIGPDVNSLARTILGTRWPYYCPEIHLTLPSRLGMKVAIKRICPNADVVVNRMMVHYSIQYLLRYLRFDLTLPRAFDVALPLPAGAFELISTKRLA